MMSLADCDVVVIFSRMLKARLKTDFSFYSLTNNIEDFERIWCIEQVLCTVECNELVFGNMLN